MKKLVYLAIVLFLGVGCSHQGSSNDSDVDTAYIAPDSVWDYSYLDAREKRIKAYSYRCYGDSNLLEEGLPDSMKLKNE